MAVEVISKITAEWAIGLLTDGENNILNIAPIISLQKRLATLNLIFTRHFLAVFAPCIPRPSAGVTEFQKSIMLRLLNYSQKAKKWLLRCMHLGSRSAVNFLFMMIALEKVIIVAPEK